MAASGAAGRAGGRELALCPSACRAADRGGRRPAADGASATGASRRVVPGSPNISASRRVGARLRRRAHSGGPGSRRLHPALDADAAGGGFGRGYRRPAMESPAGGTGSDVDRYRDGRRCRGDLGPAHSGRGLGLLTPILILAIIAVIGLASADGTTRSLARPALRLASPRAPGRWPDRRRRRHRRDLSGGTSAAGGLGTSSSPPWWFCSGSPCCWRPGCCSCSTTSGKPGRPVPSPDEKADIARHCTTSVLRWR